MNNEMLNILENQEITINNTKTYLQRKRCLDLILASLALIILSPIFLIICVIVYIDDPEGSPIYVSERCGKDAQKFRLYKFRTMCVNAESKLESIMHLNEMTGPVFKIKKDPRITKLGRFLRETSLDELPQLINIIKGEMSIVGVRPPIPREVKQYNSYQMQRLKIKPGLTCYWQIQANRNSISFDDWVALDLKYIRNQNFKEDFKIIIKTIGVMIKREGI